MKLIRIGSAPSCDIVLKSDYVSSLHAELTLLNDGSIILEDKNSRNGTKVGNERIQPGTEVTVQRGDLITFADKSLVWAQVPKAENLSGYKAVYNIGSNYRNDIIVNGQTVSRYHASLRIKDGKAFIRDNGSRNGTLVNGVKIEPNKDVRIKKGENIVCGAEDLTEQLQSLIPGSPLGKIAAIVGGAVAVAAVVVAAILLWPSKSEELAPIDPSQFRPATVYVRTVFHPVVVFDDDNPMPGEWDGKVQLTEMSMLSQATAFFLDSLGRMGTNRHVALPWEELSQTQVEQIRQAIENNLPKININSQELLVNYVQNSYFGKIVYQYACKKYSDNGRIIQCIVDVTARLRKAHYTVSGEIDHITVGYPGNYYTHEDEFQRCNVLKVSDTKDIDLAILQLNNKKTPAEIQHFFSPSNFFVGTLEPLKDQLYTIGYPAGIKWAQDEKSKSLEPNIRETKCSKEPGKYDFEFQASSVGGSSGSPVFNQYGQLVGVLYGGYTVSGGSTMAVHAKYLKKMYEEEVGL